MRFITVEQSRRNVPGEKSPPPPPPPFLSGAEFPSLHGLIEATTNFGLVPSPDWAGDCAEASMRRHAANLAISPPAASKSGTVTGPIICRSGRFMGSKTAKVVSTMISEIGRPSKRAGIEALKTKINPLATREDLSPRTPDLDESAAPNYGTGTTRQLGSANSCYGMRFRQFPEKPFFLPEEVLHAFPRRRRQTAIQLPWNP